MTKDLFIKYLQGNCTEKEFEELLLWMKKESQTNSGKRIVKEIWNEFEPDAGPVERIKYNRLLDKIHHQINISQNPQQLKIPEISTGKRILSVMTRVAAILLLPVLLLLLYTNLPSKTQYAENSNDLTIEAPVGSRIQMELGDGTKVWLNHNSKLIYPYRFQGKNRKVFLTGEACFEVAHNKEVPFIVETNRLEVKATGTTFNVNAYPDDDVIETTLIEGKVIVYEKSSNREIKAMSPDEYLKFDIKNNTFTVKSGNTAKYIAWKSGLLVFKNDPIIDIAKRLERWYNVKIEFTNEKVKELTYTATFADETLPQVLELMALATPVSYRLIPKEKLPDGSFSKQKILIGLRNN